MSLMVAPLSPLLSSRIVSRRWAVQTPKRTSGVGQCVERRESPAFTFSRCSSSRRPMSVPQEMRDTDGREGAVLVEMALVGLGVWMVMGDAAVALGPEGPVVEEFWENMRRYGLYFFTVGTGALYTILKPIYDLLTSPTSAIFIILFISSFFYLLYLVLTAMIGLSDFSYHYAS